MAFTGNSGYAGAAAFAIEQSVEKKWQMVWTSAHPLIAALADKKLNFNRGFEVKGTKMILAIMGDNQTTPVAGVASGSGELVAMTINQTAGFSQAAYNFAHYRGNYSLLESEAKLLANGARGNLLEGKADQMIGSWMNTLSGHLSSTTADASDNSRVLGLYQVLSTSNTVGGISQTTDTQWAANVTTGAGAFALDLIDDKYDAVMASVNQQRGGKLDLALASYSATNNVYGKWRSAIAPAERFENKDFTAKYGFTNFVYMGIQAMQDNRIANTLSGSIGLLSSATWYAFVQKVLQQHPIQRLQGTDAYERFGTAWAALGCKDPGLNALIRDIS